MVILAWHSLNLFLLKEALLGVGYIALALFWLALLGWSIKKFMRVQIPFFRQGSIQGELRCNNSSHALVILQERFARGEITTREYESRKKVLQHE